MEISELISIITKGETSHCQFKRNMTNQDSMAEEMVAFCNSGGGLIIIGVSNDGTVIGLTSQDIDRLNQLVSNAASQSVSPPALVSTESLELNEGLVFLVRVADGMRKPYTHKGTIVVKSGSDKRKVTAPEEMQRMFQASKLIHGDEVPVPSSSVSDLNTTLFSEFVRREYDEELETAGATQLLKNMNLMRENTLNVAGVLLFSSRPQFLLPIFIVKAVAFPEDSIVSNIYDDSEDLSGDLGMLFGKALAFIKRNLKKTQGHQSVNSQGVSEIPDIVFEELLANAFIHRDYFISAAVRLLIFSDRIEIVSPGHLPNNLTIENIKRGNSNMRNPILASFATRILPYRGIGSGIRRALAAYPAIDFEEDRDGNLFTARIWLTK